MFEGLVFGDVIEPAEKLRVPTCIGTLGGFSKQFGSRRNSFGVRVETDGWLGKAGVLARASEIRLNSLLNRRSEWNTLIHVDILLSPGGYWQRSLACAAGLVLEDPK